VTTGCHNLFPEYLWLATMTLLAALPPTLLALHRWNARPPRWFILAVCAWLVLCTLFSAAELVGKYRAMEEAGVLPERWAEILPQYVLSILPVFKKTGGAVLGCSGLLTLLVWAVIAFRRSAALAPCGGYPGVDGQPAEQLHRELE